MMIMLDEYRKVSLGITLLTFFFPVRLEVDRFPMFWKTAVLVSKLVIQVLHSCQQWRGCFPCSISSPACAITWNYGLSLPDRCKTGTQSCFDLHFLNKDPLPMWRLLLFYFSYSVSFVLQKCFNFMRSHVSVVDLKDWATDVVYEGVSRPMSSRVFSSFCSVRFSVSSFTWRSLIFLDMRCVHKGK